MYPQSPMPLERRKLDILQLFFFLLGAPHISGALRSAERRPQRKTPIMQYVSVGLLAMAIASAAEMFWL